MAPTKEQVLAKIQDVKAAVAARETAHTTALAAKDAVFDAAMTDIAAAIDTVAS